MWSMEYCTGLFVWGLEVCAYLVVGGVCVTGVRGGGLRCLGVQPLHTFHIISFFRVQKTVCCNSTSNAPDDGCMYPKHVELRIYQ